MKVFRLKPQPTSSFVAAVQYTGDNENEIEKFVSTDNYSSSGPAVWTPDKHWQSLLDGDWVVLTGEGLSVRGNEKFTASFEEVV